MFSKWDVLKENIIPVYKRNILDDKNKKRAQSVDAINNYSKLKSGLGNTTLKTKITLCCRFSKLSDYCTNECRLSATAHQIEREKDLLSYDFRRAK